MDKAGKEEDIIKNKRRPKKKNDRIKSSEIEKSLREIYENPEVASDSINVFDHGPSRGRWSLLWAALVFSLLLGAAWAGFFIFRPPEKFAGDGIELKIEASSDLTTGAEEEIVITYKNNESVPLGAVDISTAYPKSFSLKSTDPEVPTPNSWKIGSLPKGVEGKITLRGTVLAAKGESITFQAYFNYKPANFNSEFQKVATVTMPVTNSLLGVVIEGPDKANPGEEVQYKIRYKNNSDEEVKGAEVRVDYAPNFFPTTAVPATSVGEGSWVLGTLAPKKEGEIKIIGKFSGSAEGQRETVATVGLVREGGEWLANELAVSSVEIVKSELKVFLVVNGEKEAGTINFGDTLRYSLSFQNRSQTTLSDVTITARVLGEPIVSGKSPILWDTLFDDLAGKRSGNSITWTKKELPALAKLEPGAEGTIDFSVEVMAAPFPRSEADYKVSAFIEAGIGRIGGVRSARIIRSETIEMKFLTDLAFVAEGRYFNDEDMAVGTGPHPPKVGETSTYRVWWTLNNSLNEIGGATVSTTLPDGVSFTGKSDTAGIGTLSYDGKTRKVTWKLEKIEKLKEPIRADFEVSITPAENQVGAPAVLTGITNVEGRDLKTESLVFRTATPITTALETDPNLSGSGEVRR